MKTLLALLLVLLVGCLSASRTSSHPTTYPAPCEADYIIKDFHFRDGQTLPELRIHYRTLGEPRADAAGVVRNAVLILHGTTGSGGQFFRDEFAGELFGRGQVLDVEKYFIILPDDIGHGKSSKPSDGLRADFPNYGYLDMMDAEHRLVVDGLRVNHLRLVMGTSMGGMHTWLWGETYADDMDALMPLASLPEQISGRNRTWRKTIIDAIRNDPAWNHGNYTEQPPSLRTAIAILFFMGSNPVQRYKEAPTLAKADELLEAEVQRKFKTMDANDVLYAVDSSRDYDPAPGLGRIKAPLLAINSADDLINPPELRILENRIKQVPHGRAVMIPTSPQTRGHGTHTIAAIWKKYLQELLEQKRN